MEKILLLMSAAEMNRNSLDFACHIARLTHSKLIGLFLENRVPVLEGDGDTSADGDMEKHVQVFEKACRKRGVEYTVHHSFALPAAVITESRFADLIIIDTETSLQDKEEAIPGSFIRQVLAKSECPVIVAPLHFNGIDEILFAYDGSASSVFAIKQFTNAFPEMTDKKIIVLQINEVEEQPVIERDKIKELLQSHYSSIGFQVLQGKASDELFSYLLGRKNIFVVMGALGPNMLSVFFRQSNAGLVMKTITLPLFIAYHD